MIDDGPRQVGQEFAHQRAHSQCAEAFAERCRSVEVEEQQHFPLLHRAVIGPDDQVEQGAQADEMRHPHHQDADNRESREEGKPIR
jgi:hypothetical protein